MPRIRIVRSTFRSVREVLDELDLLDRPQALVFNQIDRLSDDELDALRSRVRSFEPYPSIFVSATSPEGVEPLRAFLLAGARSRLEHVEVEVPAADGKTVAILYRDGEVLDQGARDGVVVLRARVTDALLGRLRKVEGVTVRPWREKAGAGTDH